MKVLLYNAFCVMLCLCCSDMEVKWVKTIQPAGPGAYVCNDIFTGNKGAVVVTGSYCAPDQIPGCFTAQYDGNGDLTWYDVYSGEPEEITYGLGLGVMHSQMQDTISETYVLCQARQAGEPGRLVLVKYSEGGALQWERTVKSGIENMYGELMLDMHGNVLMCAWLSIAGEPDNIFLAKVDPAGELMWLTTYAHPSFNIRDVHFDMRTGEQVIVGGIADLSRDFFYLRYGEQGDLQTLNIVDLEGIEQTCAAVRLSSEGTVYLTGTSVSDTSRDDYVTVALDMKDSLLWVQYYDSDGFDDAATAMTIDEAGNVYVTGICTDERGRTKIVTLGYGADGTQDWVSTYRGAHDENAEPYALYPAYIDYMTRGVASNFYLTGRVGSDVLILKHNTGGLYTWAHRQKGEKGSTYSPAGVSYHSLAMAETSEKGPGALICRYGKAERWGCARWD
jgi:hypothetical protein